MDPQDRSAASMSPPSRSPLRKVGLVLILVVSVYLSAVSTYQILSTTLFPDPGTTQYSCREGAKVLYESVARARQQTAALDKPEREALALFRRELAPTWAQANAIAAACTKDNDQQALKALRSVTLLRYAEERAVRYQAIDLTRFRKQAPDEVLALSAP